MRIAVASTGLDIAPSFSQCENFNYYATKGCEIVSSQNIPVTGLTAEDCAQLLERMDVIALICDEIGSLALESFKSHSVMVVEGKRGNALRAAEELVEELADQIEQNEADLDEDE